MKGKIMSENVTSKSMDQILAEADELVQKINSDALNDLKEEHRLQVEKHAQTLKKYKAKVENHIERKGTSEMGHSAEGMHEAIQEIAKAMGELARYLT
jgi:Skp family chaperone for outer membrane proteins